MSHPHPSPLAVALNALADRLGEAACVAESARASAARGEPLEALGTLVPVGSLLAEATALHAAAVILHREAAASKTRTESDG